jgi:hypothetical protein
MKTNMGSLIKMNNKLENLFINISHQMLEIEPAFVKPKGTVHIHYCITENEYYMDKKHFFIVLKLSHN